MPARKKKPSKFSRLYESRDSRLCVFEDEHGHLTSVRDISFGISEWRRWGGDDARMAALVCDDEREAWADVVK